MDLVSFLLYCIFFANTHLVLHAPWKRCLYCLFSMFFDIFFNFLLYFKIISVRSKAKIECAILSQKRGLAMTEEQGKKEGVLKRLTKATSEFIYGMSTYETVQFALQTRGRLEHLFILITMGDLLGVPILRPYYSLRILPHVVPKVATWKREMLQERDLTDALV